MAAKITDLLDFIKDDDLITVQYREQDEEVKLHAFHNYLIKNSRLEWVIDWSDAGEHKQLTGTSSLAEYFEHTPHEEILIDLHNYIDSKAGGIFQTILKQFRL